MVHISAAGNFDSSKKHYAAVSAAGIPCIKSGMKRSVLLFLLVPSAHAISWFSLFERGSAATEPALYPRELALYPLPTVYLPGSTCTLRNIEPRNIALAREQTTFVASLLNHDRLRCASVGAVLRIESVRAEPADSSGKVLASSASSKALRVECTVLGRVRLLRCKNLEAWSTRETYLMAETCDYEDEDPRPEFCDGQVGRVSGDVEGAIYHLVDALLESEGVDSIDTAAAVAALEEAALHIASGRWWQALELWQRHCATRAFAVQAQHQAERNEFLIDAKLREGGALQVPVLEHTLSEEDRVKLRDLDRRANEALDQMGLDDAETFQSCLEAQSASDRAKILHEGVLREAGRLARRAALQRAIDAS